MKPAWRLSRVQPVLILDANHGRLVCIGSLYDAKEIAVRIFQQVRTRGIAPWTGFGTERHPSINLRSKLQVTDRDAQEPPLTAACGQGGIVRIGFNNFTNDV